MNKGIIYICTTSVEGLIKIGRTDNFNARMNILEQNSYWNVSGLKRFYAVRVDDYIEKEKLIHTIFSKSQVANSELFALDKNLAKDMLDAFEGKIIYPEQPKKQINDNAQIINKKRKTPTRFNMVNIPVGSTLVFIKDHTITVTTVDDINKVNLNGKVMAISEAAARLRGKNSRGEYPSTCGQAWFTYNDKLITELRDELDKKGS